MGCALGNGIRIGITVLDASGTLVDPATITVVARRPDGTTAAPATPAKDGTGTYHYDYEPPATNAMAGRHYLRIVATNPDAAYEPTIYFAPSRFV